MITLHKKASHPRLHRASVLMEYFHGDETPDCHLNRDQAVPVRQDRWYYPSYIANDLHDVDLPQTMKEEILACAWEYTRCVIPQCTNRARYVSFMRIIVIGIVAEFRGDLVDVTAGDDILGYNLSAVLAALFEGTPGQYVKVLPSTAVFLLSTRPILLR